MTTMGWYPSDDGLASAVRISVCCIEFMPSVTATLGFSLLTWRDSSSQELVAQSPWQRPVGSASSLANRLICTMSLANRRY